MDLRFVLKYLSVLQEEQERLFASSIVFLNLNVQRKFYEKRQIKLENKELMTSYTVKTLIKVIKIKVPEIKVPEINVIIM